MTRQEALAVLGLSSSANLADLKTAYRRLAAKCHPDLHPSKANATQQFQRINAAHQLLKSKLPAAPKPEPKAKPKPKPAQKPVRASAQQMRAARGYAAMRDPAPKGQMVNIYC